MREKIYVATVRGLAILGMLVLSACAGDNKTNGGGGQGATPVSSVSVTLLGAPADINVGDSLPITAQVLGSTNPAVTWTVDDILNGNADVGTISGSGNTITYMAPANEGSHILAATHILDTTKSATGQLRIHRSTISSVTVAPTTWTLNVGAQKQCSATVTGTGSYSPAITWSAQRGTISSTGLYTAPSTSGSDVVTAMSAQDASKISRASITVTGTNPVNPTITAVAVSPTSWTLSGRSQKQFAATVTGTGSFSTGVIWSAQSGSILSNGLYTAPSSGNDVVTATSTQDPSKSASSSVTVTAVAAATASLSASTTTPPYGATNVTITPVFTGAVSAVVGTSQGSNDISNNPTSGVAIPVWQGGFVPSASSLFFTSYKRSVSAAAN